MGAALSSGLTDLARSGLAPSLAAVVILALALVGTGWLLIPPAVDLIRVIRRARR
jgi:hypothetical protein